MKKSIFALIALSLLLCFAGPPAAHAQVQMISSGTRVLLTYPTGNSANESYTFPSYDAVTTSFDDTVTVTMTDLETQATVDSISATTLVELSPSAYMKNGCKLYLKLQSDGTYQTVYVKHGSTVVDTVRVADSHTYKTYIYNGTTFYPADKGNFPYLQGTVTQASSITTGVTCNSDVGIITTVSSTLAADASASFTLTNSAIKAGSIILLQGEYGGNGFICLNVTSVSAGSAVIEIDNCGAATLNAVVKIHYAVINK